MSTTLIAPTQAVKRQLGTQTHNKQHEEMLRKHLPIVRIILAKMRSRLPANADWEELHSAGVLGLVEAVHKFDPKRGYTFETFASFRIRGAIQDSLRNLDCLSRTARKKCKTLTEVESILSQKLGRAPTETEISTHMGINALTLRKLRTDTAPRFTISLQSTYHEDSVTWEETLADESAENAHQALSNSEVREALVKKLESLPYRQRKILHLYYFEGQKLNTIAAELGVTEARISQIRTEALGALKEMLSEA